MKNSNFVDLTGMKFGKLTAFEYVGKSSDGRTMWLCRCECGDEKAIRGHDLRNGRTKSCGCLRNSGRTMKQGTSGTRKSKRLYGVWAAIIQRCENPNAKRYSDYGGRGIKICSDWRNSFSSFEKWAFESGYDEKAPQGVCTIDRIDNDGNYCPENCRWVTNKEQCNNKRNNRVLTCDGESHTIQEWAGILGIQDGILRDRLFKLGWSVEKAIKTPVWHNRNHERMIC